MKESIFASISTRAYQDKIIFNAWQNKYYYISLQRYAVSAKYAQDGKDGFGYISETIATMTADGAIEFWTELDSEEKKTVTERLKKTMNNN